MIDPALHVEPGIYEHYKGGLYYAPYMSSHSETDEELVNYHPLYPPPPDRHVMQTRPARMWHDILSVCHNCRRKAEECPCPPMHQDLRPTQRFKLVRPA